MKIRDFLQSFFECTKLIEDRHATINRVLLVINFLLDEYQKAVILFVNNDYLKIAVNDG